MNVYDFDKTVFLRESSSLFYFFCARRHPKLLLQLPKAGWQGLRCALHRITLKEFKEAFHGYLRMLEDTESLAEQFWDAHEREIPVWLPPLLPKGGLVISASPEFLIAPMCRRLGLRSMGTRMDVHTGRITGENCRGAEKPRRFREEYPDAAVEVFYSDSLADTPMAELADKAWIVRGNELSPWPKENKSAEKPNRGKEGVV